MQWRGKDLLRHVVITRLGLLMQRAMPKVVVEGHLKHGISWYRRHTIWVLFFVAIGSVVILTAYGKESTSDKIAALGLMVGIGGSLIVRAMDSDDKAEEKRVAANTVAWRLLMPIRKVAIDARQTKAAIDAAIARGGNLYPDSVRVSIDPIVAEIWIECRHLPEDLAHFITHIASMAQVMNEAADRATRGPSVEHIQGDALASAAGTCASIISFAESVDRAFAKRLGVAPME